MPVDPRPGLPADTGLHLPKLQALVGRFCGLRVEASRLENALVRAWPALNVSDVGELNRRLESPTAGRIWDALLPFLTVNETYFLREPRQLEEFMSSALPALTEAAIRRGTPRLEVLSAGCATGEECYTLAILLANHGARARVQGVDIDAVALAAAKAGVYGPSSFRGVPEEWRDRHFEPAAERRWRIRQSYRDAVSFDRDNLLELGMKRAGSRFDVIFCRNVLIYFDRETQLSVLASLRDLLVPGGILCLGHAELFFDVDFGMEMLSTERATMYRLGVPV